MRGWKIAHYSQSCLIGSMQSAALVLDAVDGATDAMELQIAVEVRQEKTFLPRSPRSVDLEQIRSTPGHIQQPRSSFGTRLV